MFSMQKYYRAWLLAGAATVAVGASTAAQADQIETVVITGSLIERSPADAPTPTVIVDAQTIAKTGQPNIANVLMQLPQVSNLGDLTPTNSNFLTSGFGISNVDLRVLGAARTLVLVNGRRQVTGSPTGSSVDLNTIPTQLIQRIDVITGGASVVYGSDAVAGVVNIILRDDFEGLIATVQGGQSSRGDASDVYAAATVGGNFGDDRGNVTVSASYENAGTVRSGDRDLSATDVFHPPGFLGGSFGPPAFSSFGLAGRYRLANGTNTGPTGSSFNPDGSLFDVTQSGFDRNPNRYIQVPVSRKVISETAHYDIFPWLRFFMDSTYALSHSSQQLEPYPGTSEDGLSKPISAGGQGILIPRTNPFIAQQGTGVGSLFADLAASPGSPGLFFYRRFADLGDRTGSVDRDTETVSFGFDGPLPFGDWKWNSYYEWGRTAESQFNGGYYDKIRMQNALNVRAPAGAEVAPTGGGGFVCDDPIAQASGCVPINLFGAGSITPEAANYVRSQITLQSQAVEKVAQITANGSVFSLPGGDAKVSVGGEYRQESAAFVPDQGSQGGTVAGNQQSATLGSFNVKEAFAETLLPILADVPLAKYLEVNGAVRISHYSTAGDATTYRLGLIYQPIDELKFRAAEATATRAPNIGELFAPNSQTFPSIASDPCSNPAAGNATTNCAAQIAALGPAAIGEPPLPDYTLPGGQAALQGVGGFISGNPGLKPETAHTLTIGAVYTPTWLDGLQATVDFYDIRLHGAIGGLGPNDTLNACYNSSEPIATNIFCQQITRQHDPVLGPIIKQINFPTFNLGSIKTSGFDLDLRYGFDMGDLDPTLTEAGHWDFQGNVTYLDSLTTDPGVIGTSPLHFAGTVGTPRFRGLLRSTFTDGPLGVTTTMNYVGPTLVDKTGSVALTAGGNKVPSFIYFDLNVSYDFTDKVQGYVGAHNLFDNRPPEIFNGVFDDTGTGTITTAYDAIGLQVYTGVNLKL